MVRMDEVRPFLIDSSANRWMCFVDGENLTTRGQGFAATRGLVLVEGDWFTRDTFLWAPNVRPLDLILHNRSVGSYSKPIRSYYYASVSGGSERVGEVTNSLWELGFQAKVFRKTRQEEKAKGVDIALAKDFLSHAFLNNYDVAFLFAGDGDYIPLVEEVKRLGKIVCVVFFSELGLNPNLRIAADYFLPIDDAFEHFWKGREKEAQIRNP